MQYFFSCLNTFKYSITVGVSFKYMYQIPFETERMLPSGSNVASESHLSVCKANRDTIQHDASNNGDNKAHTASSSIQHKRVSRARHLLTTLVFVNSTTLFWSFKLMLQSLHHLFNYDPFTDSLLLPTLSELLVVPITHLFNSKCIKTIEIFKRI